MNDQALGEIIQFALDHAPYVRGVHIQPMTFLGRNSMDPNEGRLTIPAVLRLIEAQTNGLMKAGDFSGGGAESPYCSFHASYLKNGDKLKALPKRQGSCCCQSSETRDTVAQQWSAKASCCDPQPAQIEAAAVGMRSQCRLRAAVVATHSQLRQRAAATAIPLLWTPSCSKQWKIRSHFRHGVPGCVELDLERLQRCYICEVDSAYGMVPFCAYNLTNVDGKALYRR